jgi:hypothetical protein
LRALCSRLDRTNLRHFDRLFLHIAGAYFTGFDRWRTPASPPFSLMNATPAGIHQVWRICWKGAIETGRSEQVPIVCRSLPLFSLWRLTQAYARSTAVLVDESKSRVCSFYPAEAKRSRRQLSLI